MKNPKIAAVTILLIILFAGTCHAEFYRYNIDELARKAKARIKEIEQKITEEEIAKELDKIAADLTLLYNEAEALFVERRYEEAGVIYRKIDRMSRSGKVLNALKKAEK